MANGETLKEIRALLEADDRISPSVSARLTLSTVADLYERLDKFIEDEKCRHDKQDAEIANLKKKSILIWIENNKPFATLAGVLLFIVFITAQDLLVPIIANALGIPLP